MTPIRVAVLLSALFLFGSLSPTHAQQGPAEGGHEVALWTGGGYGVKGVARHSADLTVGARYGWVLTSPHGPGLLRGRFEYAVDLIPVFLVEQRHGNSAFGAGVDPLNLKWNFDSHGRFVPYMELSGGVVATNNQVPPGTSRVNFATSAGLGVYLLTRSANWSADLRFMHVSNAGLESVNPGLNTVQLRIGVGWFSPGHRKS